MEDRIAGTAIEADVERQAFAVVPITHYFDLCRICEDCQRPFIFFAEEQKHWYEQLGFYIWADCPCCVPCRKRQQELARFRRRYEALCHVIERSADEDFEMAECCLALINAGDFSRRQFERVRMLLNRTRTAHGDSTRFRAILADLERQESLDRPA